MTRETEAVEARARLLLGHVRETGMRMSGDQRISEGDAAQLLGVHCDTLRKWRDSGNAPSFYRIGGHISYCITDLASFILSGRHSGAGTRMY